MNGTIHASVKSIGDLLPDPVTLASPKKYDVTYHLVISEHFEDVEKRVNDLLARGWQPTGGICIFSKNGNVLQYGQALIRY